MTNTTTTNTVNMENIKKADKFLVQNYLLGTFYLFCGEMRKQGIEDKWDHEMRLGVVTGWVKTQELNVAKEDGIEEALTEWYEKVYLPSKWTNNPYKRYKKKDSESAEAQSE